MCFYSRTLVSLLAPIHTLSMTYYKGDNKNKFHWSFLKSILVSQNIFKHKRLLLFLLFKNMAFHLRTYAVSFHFYKILDQCPFHVQVANQT